MTEDTNNQESAAQEPMEQEAPEAEKQPETYYQLERAAYQQRMAGDMDGALERYGFAFFHSLPPKERALYKKKMGIADRDPAEVYNLGVAHMMDGDLRAAIDCWLEALEAMPSLAEAAYNLGLAYDELNDVAQAKEFYQLYLDICDDAAGISRVRERLTQMGAAK